MALRGGAQDSFHSTLGTTRTAQFLTHLQGGTLGLPPEDKATSAWLVSRLLAKSLAGNPLPPSIMREKVVTLVFPTNITSKPPIFTSEGMYLRVSVNNISPSPQFPEENSEKKNNDYAKNG